MRWQRSLIPPTPNAIYLLCLRQRSHGQRIYPLGRPGEETRDLREHGKHIDAWPDRGGNLYPALREPARLRDLDQEVLHGHDIVNNLVTNDHAELTRQIRG
jgi:hypothetical protein